MALSNTVKGINSQCQVVVYPWRSEALVESGRATSVVSDSGRLDVSSRLMNVSFSKQLNSPSGAFSFTLANNTGLKDPDWKNIIRPGHWCVIYMTQNNDLEIRNVVTFPRKRPPRSKIRCIGYIERVAVSTMVNDRGAFDAVYEVSGRDFGIVYEATTIWHDLFQFDQNLLLAASGALPVIGDTPLDTQMRIVHELFYAPGNLLPSLNDMSSSLTSIARQWLLPKSLVRDVGGRLAGGKASFWGNITNNLDFRKSAMNVPINNPVDFLSGNAWGQLKQLSQAAYHELFCETTDGGIPKLNFRPIPWGWRNRRRYPSLRSFVRRFVDNPRAVVNAVDVMSLNLGQDSQNRKNHFITTIKTALFNTEDNISNLMGTRFPLENRDSVRRHGFQPMHVDINSLTLNSALGDGKTNKNLLIEFNEVIYDYWNNAIFLESGSLEKIGSNDIKIGKCLLFGDDVPYASNRLYYIEGYSDTFIVEENGAGIWTQSVQLTRGADLGDYQGNTRISSRSVPFDQEGGFVG